MEETEVPEVEGAEVVQAEEEEVEMAIRTSRPIASIIQVRCCRVVTSIRPEFTR